MTPAEITTIGTALYGEPWLEKMANALGYSTSQLWRVVYDGKPVTRRMQREMERLAKRHKRYSAKAELEQVLEAQESNMATKLKQEAEDANAEG